MRRIRLTFKYEIKTYEKQNKILEDLIWHVSKVYNILNYDIKNKKEDVNLQGSVNIESSKIYKKYRKENWHSKYLHSHMLLEVIIDVIRDNKSYIAIKEEYEKQLITKEKSDTEKIKGKPREPRFKKENKTQITFTKYAIRKEGQVLKLSLSKEIREKYKVESLNFLIPKKLEKLVDFSNIKMIRIKKNKDKNTKKHNNNYILEIIYEKEEKEKAPGNNIVAIDLGMNNLVTCTSKKERESFIVSGESLKSKISYINREIARLEQIQMHMVGNKKYKNTKRINKLYEQRRKYVNTYMHKASREVINFAIQTVSSRIVIGDIKNIKQNMKGNKNFVQIPLQNLVSKIKYKAKLEGIEVELIEESYTSGVSAIDLEEITKNNYDKTRRIERGIFVTNKGKKINSDVNGSLNILRKYIKKCSPNQEIAMDIGREQRPIKKRIA